MKKESLRTRLCIFLSDKGNITLFVTLLAIGIGSCVLFTVGRENKIARHIGRYLLSIGLFAFAGGITNWIAIKMLFHKIPFVYGSGVLRRRYKVIRQAMKQMILATFFQPEFLTSYIPQKIREAAAKGDIEHRIHVFLTSGTGQRIIDEKIDGLSTTPEGQLVQSANINIETFKPLIKPVIISFLADLGPSVLEHMIEPQNGALNLDKLRGQLDSYMTERMLEVSPEMIQNIMYTVVLQYFGWLVVWGCLFGSVMGAVCEALELSSDYSTW